jgi:hypothetical protein
MKLSLRPIIEKEDMDEVMWVIQDSWIHISGVEERCYIKPVKSLRAVSKYLTKYDKQRIIPKKWRGKMTFFWGYFGYLPELEKIDFELPEEWQGKVRGFLADTIAEQNSWRSYGYAESIRSSTGAKFVRMTQDKVEKLLKTFPLCEGGPDGGVIELESCAGANDNGQPKEAA